MFRLKIFKDMNQVYSNDPRTRVLEIWLQNAKARCMARHMPERETLCNLNKAFVERCSI